MITRHGLPSWGYVALAVAGAGVISVAPTLWLSHPGALGLPHTTRLLLTVLAATLSMAWAVTFAGLAFQAAEEFRREASKFAWYWGGALGVGVSAPIYVFIVKGGLELIGAGPPAAARQTASLWFAAGYGLMGLSLVAGYAVARLWWTFSKR